MECFNQIIFNEQEFYQECIVCKEQYDIDLHNPGEVYNRSPILINCGHTICYLCSKNCAKQIIIEKKQLKGVKELKCPICSEIYYQPDDLININYQFIQFYQDERLKCKQCKKILDKNKLPFFIKNDYYVEPQLVNINSVYDMTKIKIWFKIHCEKQNLKQKNLQLSCRSCTKDQASEDRIQKNFIFSQIFEYVQKYKCNERRCKIYYDINLEYTCQCFYNQLREDQLQNLIHNDTMEYLNNTMMEDFKRLYKIFIQQSELRTFFAEYQTFTSNFSYDCYNNSYKKQFLPKAKQIEQQLKQVFNYSLIVYKEDQIIKQCKEMLKQNLQKYINSFAQNFSASHLQILFNEQIEKDNKNLTVDQIFEKQNFKKRFRINVTILNILRKTEKHIKSIQQNLSNTQPQQFFRHTTKIKGKSKLKLEKILQNQFNKFVLEAQSRLQILEISLKYMFLENYASYKKRLIKAGKVHQVMKKDTSKQYNQKLIRKESIGSSKSI